MLAGPPPGRFASMAAEAASPLPPRYTDRPLPPYRFVPGRSPHPHRDVGGHRGEGFPAAPAAWSAAEWPLLEPWLYAIDLHNRGYWWEAHEVLEELWHAAGRASPRARFVQGIIHLAAAHLNRLRGREHAARRQAERGIARLEAAAGGCRHMGIDVPDLVRRVRASFAAEGGDPVVIELRRSD